MVILDMDDIIVHQMGVQSSQSKPVSTQQVHHPYFLNVQIDNHREIMQISVPIESETEYQQFQANLQCLSNFDEYYLLLPKEYQFMRKAICGSSGLLQISYDNYPFLLEDEIGNRMAGHNHFSEMEMWYLIYGLVSTANLFEELGIKIGDVRPGNIFINEDGQVKIGNLLAWPNERTNYQKFIFDQILTYLSPEELKCSKEGHSDIYVPTAALQNKKKPITGISKPNGLMSVEGKSKISNRGKLNSSSGDKKVNIGNGKSNKLDRFVCESFSIGVTMLESATLKRSSQIYKKSEIDKQQLGSRIGQLLSYDDYGISLKLTIAGLCELNVEDRLSAVEIYQELKQFDSQIVNLKPCEIQIPKMKNMHKYTHLFKNLELSLPNTPQRDTNKQSFQFYPKIDQMDSQVSWVHSGIPHYAEGKGVANERREQVVWSENTYVNFPISTVNSQNYDSFPHTSTPTFNSNHNITFSMNPQNPPGTSTHKFQYPSQIQPQQVNQHYQHQIQQYPHQYIYEQQPQSKPQFQYISQHSQHQNSNVPQLPQFPITTAHKNPHLFAQYNQTSNSNPSNFSNLSSIPHQSDYGSVHKMGEDLNAFTPTSSIRKTTEKELGEGFDLLRKIDEGILDSQKKFWNHNI